MKANDVYVETERAPKRDAQGVPFTTCDDVLVVGEQRYNFGGHSGVMAAGVAKAAVLAALADVSPALFHAAVENVQIDLGRMARIARRDAESLSGEPGAYYAGFASGLELAVRLLSKPVVEHEP